MTRGHVAVPVLGRGRPRGAAPELEPAGRAGERGEVRSGPVHPEPGQPEHSGPGRRNSSTCGVIGHKIRLTVKSRSPSQNGSHHSCHYAQGVAAAL